MLSILRTALQDALRLAKIAGTPLLPSAPATEDEQVALRKFADPLAFRLREAIDHLNAVQTHDGTPGWNDVERALFGQWLSSNFPNEASAGTIALGDAWKEGVRVGSADLEAYKEGYRCACRDLAAIRQALGVGDEYAGWSKALLDAITVLKARAGAS
ncbi:hypothetical protein [Paraburkholderia rhizosphaerae]|uniref:Uncharacterized protein n=1 Tax=Paraburkholderia rhizosphaerae TaxID=480658 RepID=A0A4R8LPP5_9BURK|nr:hypothetical protein [Paraburkholderia rhizosphaerae]TDY48297.1 hypothetical protein BX592_111232 [Paraburkholderia rhizosphaerae]